MNQRLQGWKLALALLIPAAMIGAAGWFAYGALSDDGDEVVSVDDNAETIETPTATALPVTQPVQETPAAPTPLVIPSAAPVVVDPTAVPAPAATAAPAPAATAVPAAPAATSAPAPAATAGPAPTATPDPSVITLACGGTFTSELATGETFGPLTADIFPVEAAANYQFLWNLGNNKTVASPSSGAVAYDEVGAYTVTVTGTSSTDAPPLTATCGTITVTQPVAAVTASCFVRHSDSTIALADAVPGDIMNVTMAWSPDDLKLDLQYSFDTLDPVVFANGASSGDTQSGSFATTAGQFSVFWRSPDTRETGVATCLAYPGEDAVEPSGTATPTPTPDIFAPAPTATSGPDSDGDGTPDAIDAFPEDATEWIDFDFDGIGDNADTDDDNDGIPDATDPAPQDPDVR